MGPAEGQDLKLRLGHGEFGMAADSQVAMLDGAGGYPQLELRPEVGLEM